MTMVSRNVPPHLRKKYRNENPPHADTASLTPEVKALKLERGEHAQAQPAQPQL
jgi:hypothetical protein